MLPKNRLGRRLGDQVEDLSRAGSSSHGAEARDLELSRPHEDDEWQNAEKSHVAIGKRKSAVARIRMSIGEGKLVVNQRTLEDYFGRETSRMIVHQPFELTNTSGQYDLAVNVGGGGVAAQATAIRHGITRALMLAAPRVPARAQEGGLHHARSARGRAQEVRSSQGPKASAVLETLSS